MGGYLSLHFKTAESNHKIMERQSPVKDPLQSVFMKLLCPNKLWWRHGLFMQEINGSLHSPVNSTPIYDFSPWGISKGYNYSITHEQMYYLT